MGIISPGSGDVSSESKANPVVDSATPDSRLPTRDAQFMRHALLLAGRAEQEGEVPVGAVLVRDGEILAEGWNRPIACRDPTAHAEIVALRAAAARAGNYRLPPGAVLYVTLEPCPMCAGAMVQARLSRLVFGAPDPLAGAAGTALDLFAVAGLNHRPQVTGGVLAEECTARLRSFFRARRG